jgi:glycosyltransferase involved in cell wall biosynthesis
MKKICFWTPYIGNVGTIKATIHSAESIKKYSDEKVEINLFKIHSEWEGYESSIEKAELNIVDFNLKKYFKNLPKYGIFSRFTMLLMMFYSIPKLIKYFNNEKPELVFGYLQGITPLIARYFSKHKPKIIVSIQGLPSFLASKEVYEKYPIWKKIEANMRIYLWKKIYKNADNIITLTEETKINILDIFDFDKQKILYIPNPIVDDEIYDKVDEIIDDSFVIENDYILAIGRYTPQKDFQTLIKAFKIVKESHQKLNLIILGEGELREQLQVLINQQKLKDKVKLYGFVSNPYKFLKKAKLFVLSSLWEDQGHTLVEATYLRVPVVSTKCPSGQVELLSHGEAGYLCEIGNEIDMAKKIIEALENIDSKKIELAYNNSLKFTSNQFYKSLKKLIGDNI